MAAFLAEPAGCWAEAALRAAPHADLWSRALAALRTAGRDAFRVSWVKGHADVQDVALGVTNDLDLHGNRAADTKATTKDQVAELKPLKNEGKFSELIAEV